MIRIAITQAAYEAIERTLALGTVACVPQPNENGERLIWIKEGSSTRSIPSGAPTRAAGGHHQASDAVGSTLDTQTTLSKLRALLRRGES
jgi:hypothetical protein